MKRQPQAARLLLPPRPRWLARATDVLQALYALLFMGGVFLIMVLICFIAALWLAAPAHASDASHPRTARSVAALHAFKKANPCPSPEYIASRPMRCPGFVVDHRVPLCAAGADLPENMAWQEYRASLVKDREERTQCAAMRRENRAAGSTQ
jgi:hypothetical protein